MRRTLGVGSVRGVRTREEREAHGVRGGSPPKGGEPHHPHGRQSVGRNSTALSLVRALRQDRPFLSGDQIDSCLVEIEQLLQRTLSVEEAARIAGEKPGTVYKAIARGHLATATNGASNVHRLEQAEVEAWMRRPRRQQSEAA